MISFFIPIRKGSKRIINKNLKKLPKYNHGLTELKIIQLKNLRKTCNKGGQFKKSFHFFY